MGKYGRIPAVVSNILLVAGLAAIWIGFAPLKLGGQVTYALVNGISMEPNYHTGDLVLVRRAPAYQIGDLVTYHDGRMNANVIHRIIGIEGDHFLLKGDNNSWIDGYQPTFDEILGKYWIYLPKLGLAVKWVRLPINMALAAGLLGGFFIVNLNDHKPKKHSKKKDQAAGTPLGMFQMGLYSSGFLALVFLALSIFAFARPPLRTADQIKYQQTGDFFYSATGAPGVYDTDTARSGEPVFTRLTCKLNLGFVYFLAGSQLEDISGSQQFGAMLLDELSGWKRTLPLTADTKFSGNTFNSKATLDLCQVQAMLTSMEQATGFHSGSYSLVITTFVSVGGKISGQAFTDTFAPNLTFNFDSLHFCMLKDASKTDPMKTVKDGTIVSTVKVDNTLSLFGATPTIAKMRLVSIVGLILSFGGLLALGFYFNAISKRSQEAVIGIKYGPLLMEVHDQNLETLSPVIDVATIDDLAKLAERQGALIMHLARADGQYYFVQTEGAAYRYVAGKPLSAGSNEDQTGIIMAAAEEESNPPT